MLTAMEWCTAPMNQLWPSGAILAAMDAPTVPPAPPRLSMMNWRPVSLPICAAQGRANASVPPPAGNGFRMVTGLLGQADWAWAVIALATEAAAATRSTSRRDTFKVMGVSF